MGKIILDQHLCWPKHFEFPPAIQSLQPLLHNDHPQHGDVRWHPPPPEIHRYDFSDEAPISDLQNCRAKRKVNLVLQFSHNAAFRIEMMGMLAEATALLRLW